MTTHVRSYICNTDPNFPILENILYNNPQKIPLCICIQLVTFTYYISPVCPNNENCFKCHWV